MVDFSGPGTPLDAGGVSGFTQTTGCHEAEMWAVLGVETTGCGYLRDKRPKILFERHVFSKLTGGSYDATHPGISAPTQGGYGAGGANQYNRLGEALALDADAALQSASWGLGQIMGENFRAAGFASVQEMVAAMVASESHQLAAMAAFLVSDHLAKPLAGQDWVSFARGYNGPDYAANNYDGQLAHLYSVYVAGPLPDLQVRTAQMLLIYRGYDPGQVDGIAGQRTAAAVRAFQAAQGLPQTGTIDAGLIAALGS